MKGGFAVNMRFLLLYIVLIKSERKRGVNINNIF